MPYLTQELSMFKNFCLLFAASLSVASLAVQAGANQQPLVCFGTEPQWSLELLEPGIARFSTPDTPAVEYRGAAARLEHLGEAVWRGADAQGGELVAWLRDASCSDNMSDTQHPVTARLSLPAGSFMAGCCRVVEAAAADTATQVLSGPTWVLQDLSGLKAQQLERLERPVTVRFADGRINGFSACNTFFGDYQQTGDSLLIGKLGSTMMACEDPASEVERSFQSAFSGQLQVALDGQSLRLSSASGTAMQFVAEPAAQLEGVTWAVKNYNNGRQAVVGVLDGASLSMQFSNGEVFGSAGCNSFRGEFKTAGNRIEFGPVATTRRACSAELMAQEQEFLAALASSVTWVIEGGVLDMHRADSERTIWAAQK
jgi:heat shock protein HslJ